VRNEGIFAEKEPKFSIKIVSRNGLDIQGEIINIETGAKEQFNDFLELAIIMEKFFELLNPELALENARSWDSDEGSVDKQGERLFKFMRNLKPFYNELGSEDIVPKKR